MQKIDFNKDWMCRCLTRDEEAYPVTLPHDAMLSEPRTQESTGEGNIGWYIGGDYEYTKNFFVKINLLHTVNCSFLKSLSLNQLPFRHSRSVDSLLLFPISVEELA